MSARNSEQREMDMSKPGRYKYFALFLLVATVGIIFDRITKVLAASQLVSGQSYDFIPGVMNFVLVYNTGAAWGMFSGAFWFFIIMALVISLAVIIYVLRYPRHTWFEMVSLGLIVAGALGNLYDRLAYREVTDFLHPLFIEFPVFNIADSCITVGVICFGLFLVFSPQSPLAQKTSDSDDASAHSEGKQDSEDAGHLTDDGTGR